MRNFFTLLAVSLICLIQSVNAQEFSDVITTGGGDLDYATVIQIDTNNNRFVAGVFAGTVQFGSTGLTSYGGLDIFIAKISPSGTYLWVRQIGGTDNEMVNDLQLDQSGNCYVAGYYTNAATVYSPSNNFNLTTNTSGRDLFVAKFSTSGNATEAVRGNLGVESEAAGIALGSNGRVYACGFAIISSTDRDAFVGLMPLNGHGSNSWLSLTDSPDPEFAADVVVDDNGNVHVAGTFEESLKVTSTVSTYYADGAFSAYIATFTPGGTFLNGVVFDGSNSQTDAIGITDLHYSNGKIYMLGRVFGTVTLATGTTITSQGSADTYYAQLTYSSSGNSYTLNAHKTLSGNATVFGRNLFVKGNKVYVTGTFQDNLSVGTDNFTNTGGEDGFLAVFENNSYKYGLAITGTSNQYGFAVAENKDEMVYVVGGFAGSSSFGTINKTSNSGSLDIYIAEVSTVIAPEMEVSYTQGSYCAGAEITAMVQVTTPLEPGNVYSFQLSDENGSFSSPTALGQITATGDTSLKFTLPATLSSGSYLIRVSSSSPALTDTGQSISVNERPMDKTIVGPSTVNALQEVSYAVSETTGSTFKWIVTNGSQMSGGNSNSVRVIWSDQHASGSLKVVETTVNGCKGDTAVHSVTIQDPTGVDEDNTAAAIRVYPNPANDFVYVKAESTEGNNIVATLRDVRGKTMHSVIINGETRISIQGLPQGVYFLEVVSGRSAKVFTVLKI